jgi:hypothetical protein
MSTKKLLLSAFGNFREVAYFDDTRPNDLLIKTFEDCEPIIERAKMLSEMEPGKEFRHAAIIPKQVLDQSIREGWFGDKKKWKAWANDPNNKAFRTWPGNL